MMYTNDHALKLTGTATEEINKLLEITGELKRIIGRSRKGLVVYTAKDREVEFSLEDGFLEIESTKHPSFVIGTEDLEEGIYFTTWEYDPNNNTLVFFKGDE
jgi:hypothetical protein